MIRDAGTRDEEARLALSDARLLETLAQELRTYARLITITQSDEIEGNVVFIRNLSRRAVSELANRIC